MEEENKTVERFSAMPKISVIVPVYNVEKYIHRCVDSILAQTFTDFELILVDDGSPDNCGKICDEYAAKDDRILVIHKENGGVSSARNAGLDAAQGDYITFVDGDDFCDVCWTESLYHKITETDADIVSGIFEIVDENGTVQRPVKHPVKQKDLFTEKAIQSHLVRDIFTGGWGWEVCARLFRADIIQNNHIRFCETCGNYAEDQGFVLECSLFCKKVCSTDAWGYKYVQHDTSMMHRSAAIIKFDSKNELSRHFAEAYEMAFPDSERDIVPIVHYLLMRGQYDRAHWSTQEQLSSEQEKIQDKKWYYLQTETLRDKKRLLKKYLGFKGATTALLFSDICLCGKSKYLWAKYKLWYTVQKFF